MGIKHAFNSAKSDGGDATLVKPSDWNADHTITGLGLAFIGAEARATTTTSVNNATFTVLAWAATDAFDTDGFHDPSTNNSRQTIPAGLGGKYLVYATTNWDGNSTGERILGYRINGSGDIYRTRDASGAANATQSYATILDLAAGDYIEAIVYQSSGGTRTTNTAQGSYDVFGLHKLDSGKVGNGIGARVYHDANQNVANGDVTVLLAFNHERWDTDGFHDTSTNNSRLTIPAGLGGKYVIGGNWYVSPSNLSGHLDIFIKKTGSGAAGNSGLVRVPIHVNEIMGMQTMIIDDAVAGDYYELAARQSSTTNPIAVVSDLPASPEFWIARLDSGSVVDSGKELDYKELASPLGLTATSEGTAQTVIASNTFTCDGAPIWAEFFASRVDYNAGAVGRAIVFDVYLDSTMKGRIAHTASSVASTNVIRGVNGKVRMTPSSGNHTVTIKTWFSNAADSATVDANAGGTGQTVPTFLAITKV